MKIKNTCDKIIGVGTINLVPDAEAPVSSKVVNSPAIKEFIKRGYLKVIQEPKVTKKGEKPVVDESSNDIASENKSE